jgi:hypothetical protein
MTPRFREEHEALVREEMCEIFEPDPLHRGPG